MQSATLTTVNKHIVEYTFLKTYERHFRPPRRVLRTILRLKYFEDDLRRLTYCMKDVYNWKIYKDLYDSFSKVDYTQLLETEDNTTGIEEISCAGGACLI